MLDDKEVRRLLLRTAARDEGSAEAFERLYRTCAPLLLGVAQRVVGRRELAEEVLHDGFSAIWRTAERFDPVAGQPLAWMVAIVRNRAIDVRSSHDVSRVDSYHDALEDDPEGALDRLFDWSQDEGENEDRRPRREMAARLPRPAEGGRAAGAWCSPMSTGLSHGDLAAHLRKPWAR